MLSPLTSRITSRFPSRPSTSRTQGPRTRAIMGCVLRFRVAPPTIVGAKRDTGQYMMTPISSHSTTITKLKPDKPNLHLKPKSNPKTMVGKTFFERRLRNHRKSLDHSSCNKSGRFHAGMWYIHMAQGSSYRYPNAQIYG